MTTTTISGCRQAELNLCESGVSAKDKRRFWVKVRKTESCWLWTGCKDHKGYGRFLLLGVSLKAHRISWLMSNGFPADPLCLHHCDTPGCVNPEHLFQGTDLDNSDDKVSK